MENGIQAVSTKEVEDLVIELRGQKVLLDRDIATLYGVETKRVNEAVKNNPDKFPERYSFTLQVSEKQYVVENFDRMQSLKKSTVEPRAFTEGGLYMLATILKSPRATDTTIAIIDAFLKLREFSKCVASMSQEPDTDKQKTLLERSSELLGDLLDTDGDITESESSIELNLAVLKIKRIVKKTLFLILVLFLFSLGEVKAQWVVTDPGNLAQAILSYSQYIGSANNTLNTYLESQKIFEQGKEYYQALKDVNELVKNGRKVEESVKLSVRAIDEYNNTYGIISSDGYFTANQLGAYNRQQSAIMKGMSDVINDITKVITRTGMSMSDKERIDALNENHERLVSLFNKSRGINMQMIGENNAVKDKKAQKRLERELLR